MINIEKVSNGWIIRGRDPKTGMPVSSVAQTQSELLKIIESLF